MQPIEATLRAALLADPDVSAIIGDRAYWMALPREPTFPAVTYQAVTRTQDKTTGIVQTTIQYTCMGGSVLAASSLADAVRCALHGYRAVTDEVRIEDTRYAGQTTDHDDTTGIYWVPVDFVVTYLEV